MEPTLPDYVTKAKNDAQRMGQVANEYASASYTIPDELKKVVQEALDYNKDVVTGRAQTFSDYQRAPAEANTRFGVQTFETGDQAGQANPNFIFNPFERNSTISQYISNQEVPFMMYNKLLGLREGSTADIVDAGTRAFGAQATAAQGRAQDARQSYTDALTQFQLLEDLKQRQFENALAERRLALDQSKVGNKSNVSEIINKIFGDTDSGKSKLKWVKENGRWIQKEVPGKSLKDEYTPELAAQLMFADPDNATLYKSALDVLTPTATQQGKMDNAISGLTSIQKARQEIERDKNIIGKSKLPGFLGTIAGASKYRTAINEVQDVFTRLRTGAALNNEEIEFYTGQLPQIGQRPEEVEASLRIFESLFERVSGQGSGLTIQDPNTGDVYQADNFNEYQELINQGFLAY